MDITKVSLKKVLLLRYNDTTLNLIFEITQGLT